MMVIDTTKGAQPVAARKQEEKAAKHFKQIQTVQNIINNPTKHRWFMALFDVKGLRFEG